LGVARLGDQRGPAVWHCLLVGSACGAAEVYCGWATLAPWGRDAGATTGKRVKGGKGRWEEVCGTVVDGRGPGSRLAAVRRSLEPR
jgi:hypothetical protein